MPIGTNTALKDRLIKNTTGDEVKENLESVTSIKSKTSLPSKNPAKATHGTRKMTFYVRADLLNQLYNFAYWDRYSVTEAVNIIFEHGLQGKETKEKTRNE